MDLFSNYLMFPNLKYFSCRIYVQIADRESIRKSFKEYNELYRLGTQCEIIYDENPVYAVAATNENRAAMLIANTSKESVPVSFDIPGTVTKCLITSEDVIEKEVSIPEFLPMSSFLFIEVAL